MAEKRRFYDRYGVEGYYEYDPDRGHLRGWQRQGETLVPIGQMEGWVSPRLGLRFGLDGGELCLDRPDGQRFVSYAELDALREQDRLSADTERQRAAAAGQRAEAERQRTERLVAQLRSLGIEPEAE